MPRFNPRANPLQASPGDFTEKSWGISTNNVLRGEKGVTPPQAASFSAGPDYLHPISTTATVTLPPASSWKGKKYLFKKSVTGAYTVTITPFGSDTIDGSASTTVTSSFGKIEIMSDGSSTWHIIG